ncbi:AcrR family transcriptional regulator [Nocardioides luteus]|uniref:Transcriptional regulator n=1 Tax=Nocardioides luteus TaxID=1844 RepID=A0ABQ5SY42_9ACTN|nr:TetR/AcrR family transcriptional regulator [Nocardioides luteus]MDR7312849.1 AcrR family transcriptional regulator [Nocardioides luteus]GGR48018.1 transcriptional regulator [Nocardioides luteus]GLJ69103.1 transcriptional regulator [Nocardioides luteus]
MTEVRAPRRRTNTRARLLAAAVDVFVERGARRVTVDDLVSAAGYTRGAFYSNFNSVDEVLLETFKEESEKLIAAVRTAVADHTDADSSGSLIGAAFAAIRPMQDRWFVLQSEVVLQSLRDPDAREISSATFTALSEQLVEVVALALDRLDRTLTMSTDLLAQTMMGVFLHSITMRTIRPDDPRADRLLEDALPQIIDGLSAPRASA